MTPKPLHGTSGAYFDGCRCQECVTAHDVERARWLKKIGAKK